MVKSKIDGVLLLNKPYGFSSNAVLQKVKRLYQAKKAGHTGTLDPLATGLLPICFGEATKFASFLLDSDKEYIASICLGKTTDTYDAEGATVTISEVNCTHDNIISCVNTFLGKIIQVPPIYSALKVNGKALYEYARSGEDVTIKSREITIYQLEILEFISHKEFILRVLSSKGTYIRSLVHDIGQKLGCGAYLTALQRTKTNDFKLNSNRYTTIQMLSAYSYEERISKLLPIDILVSHLPRLYLNNMQYQLIKFGHKFKFEYDRIDENNNILTVPILKKSTNYSLYFNNRFLGIAKISDGFVVPVRLLDTSNLCIV